MGVGVVQSQRPENSPNNVVFFFFFFLCLFSFSPQRGSNDFITEKTILFQGSRGSNFFPGGGGGGSKW